MESASPPSLPGPFAPPPPDLTKSVVLEGVEDRGEFYVLTTDGRTFSGQEAAHVPIKFGAHSITGPQGGATLTLPDDTTFSVAGDLLLPNPTTQTPP
jgi:hypothetical protein